MTDDHAREIAPVSAIDIADAKDLIRRRLALHPDPGVRAINALTELPDDDFRVKLIAETIRDMRLEGKFP